MYPYLSQNVSMANGQSLLLCTRSSSSLFRLLYHLMNVLNFQAGCKTPMSNRHLPAQS